MCDKFLNAIILRWPTLLFYAVNAEFFLLP